MKNETLTEALELRRKIKAKKPDFIRQEAYKKIRLGRNLKWKKPKGRHSKLRLHMKGHSKCVQVGYGSPKLVKHLDRSGLKPIVVCSIKDLEKIDVKTQGAVISKSLGDKKRIDVFNKAKEIGCKILNIKNVDDRIKNIKQNLENRKYAKMTSEKERETKKRELEKKSKEKEDAEKKEQQKEHKMSEEELAQKIEAEEQKKKKEQEHTLIHNQ